MSAVALGRWYSAGPHRLLCDDVERGAIARLHAMAESIDMIYTDPPWGNGNAKYWRTYANKHGVTGRDANWSVLMDRLIGLADAADPPVVVIEMGTRWSGQIAARLLPGRTVTIHAAAYGPRLRPNHVIVATRGDHSLHAEWPVMHGLTLTRWIFDRCAVPGGIAVDPFIGRGMTARVADEHGMVCVGSELCPHRLTATMTMLTRRGHLVEML